MHLEVESAIRNKQYKYIYSGSDPDLLYDLEQDPNERHNCIAEPGLSDLVEEFQAKIVEKWDIPSLTQDCSSKSGTQTFPSQGATY